MAITKVMEPFEAEDELDMEDEGPEIEIEVEDPEGLELELEDGSIVIDFGDGMDEILEPDHGSNLVEFMDDDEIRKLASDLVEQYNNDADSRKEWVDAYTKGLDLLGMKVEDRTQPWAGASGVFHPMMTEAAVRFQAQAMGELFPAAGPVRTKIVGRVTPEKYKQGIRVETELNYLLTEKMTDYREELEQLLMKTALAGSGFKKVYYDQPNELPSSIFVPAEDLVVSYGTSDLFTSERYTHVMRKTKNEVRQLQVDGFYADIELSEPHDPIGKIKKKEDDIDGQSRTYADDDRYVLLEMHVMINLPGDLEDPDGLARPYIVTIEESSMKILSIRKNWYESDEKMRKRMHFVHYRYLPGMGFYGLGLIHLIGGLTKSATSIMRQLIDAGTLSNMPAGLKARGLRMKGDNTPMMPGEFRDVDVPGGNIRDAITFIPYKEPSSVLYQLLGNVVEEGRRIGSVADLQIGDVSANAPVGTTLALMERAMKVMGGVQARMHAAMKKELRLISKIVHDFMPDEYAYEIEGDYSRVEDFDGRVDVIPVSDPNASTMSQRILQYQAALQLSTQAPQLYDLGKLHRQMLEVLGIQDAGEIIKLPDEIKPKDPVSENMAILKQEPVKAFAYQDHQAHIATHMGAMQDPKIQEMVGQSPFASAIQSAMMSHITEHVAMEYRVQIQKKLGVELPDPESPLPEDVEFQLSSLVAEAQAKLTAQNAQEAQQAEAEAEAKNPLTIIQERELAIKEKELQHKIEMDRLKNEIERAKVEVAKQKADDNAELGEMRIRSEDQRAGAQIGARLATELDNAQRKDKLEGARIGLAIAKELNIDEREMEKNRGAD